MVFVISLRTFATPSLATRSTSSHSSFRFCPSASISASLDSNVLTLVVCSSSLALEFDNSSSRSLPIRFSRFSVLLKSLRSFARLSFSTTLSSSWVRKLVSNSAHALERARFCRSMLSNCLNKGAVLLCTSMLNASALRTASCHRFRRSDTSCRRASSRNPASLSLFRNFTSISDNKSPCSFRNLFDSLLLSKMAPFWISSISFLTCLISAFSSLDLSSKERFAAALRSLSSLTTDNSVSSLVT
mmetsp:Transcript_21521/g.49667  ORF Transcript_21521/g.49667 Transcript_21521/m.49667 type:complete len:244 (-) Transcript_21521:854-1585(-)